MEAFAADIPHHIAIAAYETDSQKSVALRVACAACDSPEGVPCLTRAGKSLPARYPVHGTRFKAFKAALAGRPSVLRIRKADAQFGLSVGDVVVAVPYKYDPDKWAVLYRATDNYDPECLQYATDVQWIGWAHPR